MNLATKYEIPQTRLEELLDLADAVMKGRVEVGQMPGFLEKAFGLDEQKARLVASDLAGYRLLPLTEFISGVEDAIEQWGGDVLAYPELRLKKPGLEDELLSFASQIGLELPDHLMKRFIFLAKGYINKERDRQASLTLLKRPITIGGLQFSDLQAQRFFEMLDKRFGEAEPTPLTKGELEGVFSDGKLKVEEKRTEEEVESKKLKVESVKSAEEIEKPNVKSTPVKTIRTRDLLVIKAVPHALTTDVPLISGSIIHQEEEAEIEEHKKQLAQKPVVDNQKVQAAIIEKTAQLLFAPFKNAKQTQASAREFTNSFVRGRIDTQRAHALLVDKYGFDNEHAMEAIKLLAQGHSEYHQSPEPIKPSVVKKKPDVSLEARVLDERHAVLTKTVPKTSIEPILPGARVSVARSSNQEAILQQKKISSVDLQQAQEKAKPAKASVRLSVQSTPPSQKQNASTKVADIVFAQKLVGPVEELGTMGITEFRRLSSDPQEAVQKILNTLDLLEETDYEQRIAGIVALRQSPLQKLYISLMQEALMQGSPVTDIAAMHRNKGEMSLSTPEIDAIVELNRITQF